jgi:hypothetical protein
MNSLRRAREAQFLRNSYEIAQVTKFNHFQRSMRLPVT